MMTYIYLIMTCHFSLSSSDRVLSICEDPVITSADRLLNNTVRIYRGLHYWDLQGLPNIQAYPDGPYLIEHVYKNMGTVRQGETVMTVLEGMRRGHTYKFDDKRNWYAWDQHGNQWHYGSVWQDLPLNEGVRASFHNGNKTHPRMIAFGNNRLGNKTNMVFYYTTEGNSLTPVPGMKSDGYEDGGAFGENYPVSRRPDRSSIIAAFSYPQVSNSGEVSDKDTFVFLFRAGFYCKRKMLRLENGESCPQWSKSQELFGCNNQDPKLRPKAGYIDDDETRIGIETRKSLVHAESIANMGLAIKQTNCVLFLLCHITHFTITLLLSTVI